MESPATLARIPFIATFKASDTVAGVRRVPSCSLTPGRSESHHLFTLRSNCQETARQGSTVPSLRKRVKPSKMEAVMRFFPVRSEGDAGWFTGSSDRIAPCILTRRVPPYRGRLAASLSESRAPTQPHSSKPRQRSGVALLAGDTKAVGCIASDCPIVCDRNRGAIWLGPQSRDSARNFNGIPHGMQLLFENDVSVNFIRPFAARPSGHHRGASLTRLT